MSASIELKKFPICDTDFWIKICKITKCDILFTKYSKALFSDAVVFELQMKVERNKDEFSCAMKEYNIGESKGRVIRIGFNSPNYFSTKEKKVVEKMFVDNKIEFDSESNCYIEKRHLGEIVSLIYAAVLNLEILLSDDGGTSRHAAELNFPYIKIIKLRQFFIDSGFSAKKANELCIEANKSLDEKVLEKELEDNFSKGIYKTKSLSTLKKALQLKGKL